MLKALRSHRFYVPAITIAASAALFFVYYFFYVSWQRSYANERAFRLLDVVSDQLVKKLDNLKNVMAASLAASLDADALDNPTPARYLADVPTLKGRLTGVEFHGPPCSASREGTLELRMDDRGSFSLRAEFRPASPAPDSPCKGDAANAFVRATVDLAPELRERFHAVTDDYFDDIFIVQPSGKVMFQKNPSGMRIGDLNAVFSATPGKQEDKSGTSSKPVPPRAFQDISQFSNVVDVRLGNAAYKLYVQPVPLKFAGNTDTRLVVCGLWRTDRLESEVVSLPYSVLIWCTLLLIAAFAVVWPLLKIVYMGASERLRRRHVFSLVFAMLALTALLSLIVLQWSYGLRADEESKEQLEALANRINRNVKDELMRGLNFLNALDRDEFLHEKFRNQTKNWTGNHVLESPILEDYDPASFLPYLDSIFWVDQDGQQQFKLTVQSRATPRTRIAEQPYFQDVRDERHLSQVNRDILTGDTGLENAPPPASLTSSIGGESRFRFDSTYSPNTGEFFVVLARPYTLPPGWSDVPVQLRNLKAQVLVARFTSLIYPVVPPGYGFAVVDHEGMVRFHSRAARNQIENFFQECRQDAALKDLVWNGKSDHPKVNYMGKRQQMFVKPLPYLAAPSYALVVFRDINYFTTVNVACLLVFALLAALAGLPLLAGFVLYLSRSGHYLLAHLWPSTEDGPKYVDIITASLCLTLAFALRFSAMKMDEALVSVAVLLVTPASFVVLEPAQSQGWRSRFGRTLVLAGICLIARWSLALLAAGVYLALCHPRILWPLRGRVKRFRVTEVYVGAVLSLLLVIVVLPCFGLFQISYNTVNRLSLEAAQLERVDQLGHREDAVNDYFLGLKPNQDTGEMKERFRDFAARRLQIDLDRYDKPVYNPNNLPDIARPDSGGRDVSALEPFVAGLSRFLPSNQMGAEMREMALLGGHNNHDWSSMRSEDGDDELLWLNSGSGDTESTLLGVYPLWHLGSMPTLLMVLFAFLLWLWVRYIIRGVFPTEIAELSSLETSDLRTSGSRHLLLIGPPEPGEAIEPHLPPGSDRLDLGRVVTTGEWTHPKLRSRVVVVDRFEFDLENPDTSRRKLKLLEQLVYVENKLIILISAVDPMFYLTSASLQNRDQAAGDHPDTDQTLDRWAHLFTLFQKRERKNLSGTYLPHTNEPWTGMIREECAHSAELRSIGYEILNAHRRDQFPPSPEQVLEEVSERAEVYYRVLWSTCAPEERLVLYQLAQDGWANPKNHRGIQQLVRRKMIRKGSGYHIMNESFCSFVRNARRPEELAQWEEEESHSAWSAMKLGLGTALLMFGAWLIYAQQDVFQLGIGYLAALGTASGAILNLARTVTGRSGNSGGAKT